MELEEIIMKRYSTDSEYHGMEEDENGQWISLQDYHNKQKNESLDTEFLNWIYHRLIYIHKEDKNTDYMIKLKKIVDENL